MKLFALILSILASFAVASKSPAFAALSVRGGAELGPLDGELAMKLAKTATTAFVAGSASKYIAAQTGGSDTQVSRFHLLRMLLTGPRREESTHTSLYLPALLCSIHTQLADFVTTDLWALNALCTAVACAMYKLGDTGFDSLKMMAVANAVALVLKFDKGGISTDTLKDNKVLTVGTVVLAVLAFV